MNSQTVKASLTNSQGISTVEEHRMVGVCLCVCACVCVTHLGFVCLPMFLNFYSKNWGVRAVLACVCSPSYSPAP